MGRTVIVGDVHGCRDELHALLELVRFDDADDLVFVGDLISRGPDSLGVLGLAMRRGARAVLGNHELRLLQARHATASGAKSPHLGPSQARLLHTLGACEWEWLDSLPLVIELAEHGARVVHAGVMPAIPIQGQSSEVLTRLRSITASGEPSDHLGEESWAARYDDGPHVVFGHDAQRGLQIHALATGLDTGCVYGGALSALVLEAGQPIPRDAADRLRHIVSVKALAAYFELRSRPKRRVVGF